MEKCINKYPDCPGNCGACELERLYSNKILSLFNFGNKTNKTAPTKEKEKEKEKNKNKPS